MRPPLVLAYHGLGRYPRQQDPHNLMVDPDHLRRQIEALQSRRYRFVRLSEFAAQLDAGVPPDGACAVTFDDGTADNLYVVAPLLAELGVPATVFVCPGLLGQGHFAAPASAGIRLMDADQLRELASSQLIQIGSHTNAHADLSSASADEAYAEMASSKHALEQLLQEAVEAFAYPKCRYSSVCPDAARRAGYTVAVTCGGLGGWKRFELARESVDSLDRRVSFALKSRRLYLPIRESLPGRAARAIARPLRHRGGDA